MVLSYLQDFGCQSEVLAVDSVAVAAPTDGWLAAGLPGDVPVHRVKALGLGWGRLPGLGTLTLRALGALRREGDKLLNSKRFDLIYFSTTQFGLHVLGPHWKQKYGTPFVMDYQDPWVNDYYRKHPEIRPPGGRLKHRLADWLNRQQEPRVLRHCSGITCVSADYPRQLSARYPWLKIRSHTEVAELARGQHSLASVILPFPGDENDLQRVAGDGTHQNVFSPADGHRHWVYAGRGGADMALALHGIFGAIQAYARGKPEFLNELRIHFIGTSYAAAGRGEKSIEPLAAAYGLAEVVREYPARLPYSKTLRCLLDASALIVPGSDDPGYTASKIYPYLLAGKPLLAVFHQQSSVVSLLEKVRGGVAISFASNESEAAIAGRIGRAWLDGEQFARPVMLDRDAFAPHTAQEQTRVLVEFFRWCAVNMPNGLK